MAGLSGLCLWIAVSLSLLATLDAFQPAFVSMRCSKPPGTRLPPKLSMQMNPIDKTFRSASAASLRAAGDDRYEEMMVIFSRSDKTSLAKNRRAQIGNAA